MEGETSTKESFVDEEDSLSSADNLFGDGDAAARIKALDRVTASNLRNSQIINKVSDIVRELVENSLDADATIIQIYLEKYGKDKIEVRDNGHGLASSDVQHIFQGGYTSKLHDSSNLSREQFLGFKGEALNAICAAGNVTVVTKSQKEAAATKFSFDFQGKIISESKLAHKVGTTITVEKLFGGIRVRRQRLDDPVVGSNELKAIEAYLKGVAIVHPKCHVSFFHDTTLVWSKASVQTVEQALYAVLGHNIAKRLGKYGPTHVQVGDGVDTERSIELYLPTKPVDMRTMSYTSNKMAMIFCNQKRVYIKKLEKLIHRYVVANAEKPQPSDQRRFPVSAVCIKVPPKEADFNLDTDKTKVLLIHEDKIYEAIEQVLIKFYGIDLRNYSVDEKLVVTSSDSVQDTSEATESKVKDVINQQYGSTSLFTEGHLENSCAELNPVIPILNTSASHITRESTIQTFLQDIPSISLGFSKSPTKSNNQEPVTVEFPNPNLSVKTATSSNTTMDKSKSARGPIANFEISLGSQESQSDEAESDQISPGIISKTHVVSDFNKSSSSRKSPEPNEREDVQKYMKDWLHGRMVNDTGDIIENVVIVTPSASTYKSQDTGKFRTIPLTKTSAVTGLGSNARNESQRPSFSQSNPMEPPFKRIRSNSLDNHSTFTPPGVPTGTPRLPTHRQVTIDSFARWPTPTTGAFSQTASKSVVGVRIPLTPNRPKTLTNAPVSQSNRNVTNENVLPKTIALWEHQQRNSNNYAHPSSAQTVANNLKSSTIWQSEQPVHQIKKLTPKVHKTIQGGESGQLYVAQTYDSVGVFSPLNMIEYFPSESSDCCTSSPSISCSNESFSIPFEDVTKMFQRFVMSSDINQTPVAGKVFHILCKLPNLMQKT